MGEAYVVVGSVVVGSGVAPSGPAEEGRGALWAGTSRLKPEGQLLPREGGVALRTAGATNGFGCGCTKPPCGG